MLEKIAGDDASVFYPPEHPDTPTTGYFAPEREALQRLIADERGKRLLGKVIEDASGRVLCSLFALLEGTADPEFSAGRAWYGMRLVPASPDDPPNASREYGLSSEFCATYADYVERRHG